VGKPISELITTARKNLHLPESRAGAMTGDTYVMLQDTFNTLVMKNESTERILKENRIFSSRNALRTILGT
jgi:hypothetical protein